MGARSQYRLWIACLFCVPAVGIPCGPSRADTNSDVQSTAPAVSPHAVYPRMASCQIVTDGARFEVGSPVHISFIVRNLGSKAFHYTFSNAQQFDVTIERADTNARIWQYSHGKQYGQLVTKLTLSPGQSKTYSVTWLQTDLIGTLAGPGQYTINAKLVPMARLVLSGGLLVDPNDDPNNLGMPTKSDAQTGATLQTDVTPPVSASTMITIAP